MYGLKPKWEQHGGTVAWGGKAWYTTGWCGYAFAKVMHAFITCACTAGTWVDKHNPHARLVRRSRFPGLLHKCAWYALNVVSFSANIRSVMWGVGCKGYPQKWWMGVLHRFLG